MTAKRAEAVRVSGITVELSNTGKTLFPDDQVTKGDLVGYYRDIAARMLPYLRDRPLSMERYPDGITGERIVQKNVPRYFPDWIARTRVKKQGGTLVQVICDRPATWSTWPTRRASRCTPFSAGPGRLTAPTS